MTYVNKCNRLKNNCVKIVYSQLLCVWVLTKEYTHYFEYELLCGRVYLVIEGNRSHNTLINSAISTDFWIFKYIHDWWQLICSQYIDSDKQ